MVTTKQFYVGTTFCCLLAALQSTAAFKIPGLSGGSSSSSNSRSPPGGQKLPPSTGGNALHNKVGGGAAAGEYMGPVFIIREQDKEKGEYDAFITTGGIQEVKPPHQHPQQPHQPHPQQQQPHPQQQQAATAYGYQPPVQFPQNGGAPLPPPAKDDEDSDYFGVLITPETVSTLNYPKTTHINVSLSTILVAASSRMPWLLVLHRKDYPAFEYQQQPQQQQQPLQPQQNQLPPGMQVPQRRRHYSERQRRQLVQRPTSARWTAEIPMSGPWYEPEFKVRADEMTTVVPLISERQLMSTMCYNFVRSDPASLAVEPTRKEQQEDVLGSVVTRRANRAPVKTAMTLEEIQKMFAQFPKAAPTTKSTAEVVDVEEDVPRHTFTVVVPVTESPASSGPLTEQELINRLYGPNESNAFDKLFRDRYSVPIEIVSRTYQPRVYAGKYGTTTTTWSAPTEDEPETTTFPSVDEPNDNVKFNRESVAKESFYGRKYAEIQLPAVKPSSDEEPKNRMFLPVTTERIIE